jgi:hypothetical protein
MGTRSTEAPRKGTAILAKRIQVEFEGKTVPADQLEFETEKEPWTVYKLEDGTVLRLKTVLATVSRLVDRYKPDGEPIYVLGLAGIPATEIPPELKQKTATTKD